ncbi:MAG: hypothetical protein K9K32_06685 [Halanaerobiales bacterium]|nr:hypothetical protein [Halanaerobiales bacterium]
MKKILYIFILLTLITVYIPISYAQEINYIDKQILINELKLKNDIMLIDRLFDDLTGDQINDQIFLVGSKPGGGNSPFYAPIKVIVYDKFNDNFYLASYDTFSGYQPKLVLYDFTGDNIKDIFVKANTGGSGGIYNHMLVSFIDNQLKVIFDHENNSGIEVSGSYVDNFKTNLVVEDIEYEIIFDLLFNKDKYIEEEIYDKKGRLLTKVTPYLYPYSNLVPIDYDLDQSFELKGTQRLVGAYGADAIGRVDTILKYENGWEVKQIELTTYLKKYDITNRFKAAYDYEIKKNAVSSGNKEIYYPEIIKLPKEVNSKYINRQLKKIVEPFFNKNEELQIDFQITKSTNSLLSVFYRGYQKYENGENQLLYSFNYDLNNNRRLTIENMFKKGDQIRNTVNNIIRDSIDNQILKSKFSGIADWMGFYITNKDLVLYYLENDFIVEHTKIFVPLKEIADYLTIDIQYDREETEVYFIEVN